MVRSHANIIQLQSWGFDHPNHQAESAIPILFIERALASVQGLLHQNKCSFEIKHQLCLGTAEGLACLHSCGIVHGDLNPKNVLVIQQDKPDVPFIAKVSDFGSSIDISDGASYCYSDYLATPGWTPPETNHDPDTLRSGAELLKCDSWAFGMFVFSVLYENGQARPQESYEGTSIVSDSLFKKLNEDCRLLVAHDPAYRPEVSSDLLDDKSKTYMDWLRTRSMTATISSKTDHEYEYDFWTSIDTNTLSQLDLEYHALGRLEGVSILPYSHVLFGMALGFFHNLAPSPGFKYVHAAARAGSNAARGVVYRLACATEHFDILSAVDKEDLEAKRGSWLFDAASSGSLVAASDLRSISTSRYKAARNLFRRRGGYQTMLQLNRWAGTKDRDNIKARLSTKSDSLQEDHEAELYMACAQGDHTRVMEISTFLAGAPVISRPFGISHLHWLFMFESLHIEDVARRLLSGGAHLEARTTTLMEMKARRHVPNEHFPFHWPIGTPLHWACFARCWTAMTVLLKLGADVDALDDNKDDQAQTPLAMAMYRGDSEVVQFLLNHGANPQKVDGVGHSPLHMLALDHGQNRLFRLRKPIMWRCYHGDEANHLREIRQCVAAAVKSGGDLDSKRRNGQTPLQDALETKDGGVVMALLEAGASVDCRFAYSGTLPVLYWLQWVNARTLAYPNLFLPVLKTLLSRSSDLDVEDSEQRNLFHGLVLGAPTPLEDHVFGNSGVLYYYTKAAAELLKTSPFSSAANSRDIHGQTPLTLALSGDNGSTKDLANLLLESGASVSDDVYDRQDLIWTICNNDTLGDLPCLDLLKTFSASSTKCY